MIHRLSSISEYSIYFAKNFVNEQVMQAPLRFDFSPSPAFNTGVDAEIGTIYQEIYLYYLVSKVNQPLCSRKLGSDKSTSNGRLSLSNEREELVVFVFVLTASAGCHVPVETLQKRLLCL